jgi:hypothetical protein
VVGQGLCVSVRERESLERFFLLRWRRSSRGVEIDDQWERSSGVGPSGILNFAVERLRRVFKWSHLIRVNHSHEATAVVETKRARG